MSKKKQTAAEEAEQAKTEAAAEETAEEKTAPETEEKTEAEEKPETEEKSEAEGKPAEETAGQPKDPGLAALNDKYLRLCAEYDNFRKRSQKEKDALYADVKANTMKSFLPVYDNLVRALKQNTEDEAYKKGVEMIMAQFKTTMEKLGVTEMECLGQKFDPAFHNAVMHVDDEEKGENEIVEVFQQGFMLGDKVIRFAMVKVAN
jgi:molecular chaperone GrpE